MFGSSRVPVARGAGMRENERALPNASSSDLGVGWRPVRGVISRPGLILSSSRSKRANRNACGHAVRPRLPARRGGVDYSNRSGLRAVVARTLGVQSARLHTRESDADDKMARYLAALSPGNAERSVRLRPESPVSAPDRSVGSVPVIQSGGELLFRLVSRVDERTSTAHHDELDVRQMVEGDRVRVRSSFTRSDSRARFSLRHLLAFLARFRKADRDRLLARFHLAALPAPAAAGRALVVATHLAFDVLAGAG